MKPKVTVITPSYNKPQFVKDAIGSVLQQTYTNFEYLVVENSTNLETKKVVRSFKDKRLRYFDENFSDAQRRSFYVPAFICNKYYSLARGEYVLYLSDDDVLFPDCLKVMVGFLNMHKRAYVCYHDQAILYVMGKTQYFEPLVRGSKKILTKQTGNPANMLDGGQIMFRREVLKSLKQPYLPAKWETANICDKIFMEKLWLRYPFFPVRKILSLHRVVLFSTHRSRFPFKYFLYQSMIRFMPISLQIFLGTLTGKRRLLTPKERIWFEGMKRDTRNYNRGAL